MIVGLSGDGSLRAWDTNNAPVEWGHRPRDRSGRLIVVEGCDGSGKTTQIELLRRRLDRSGRDVVVTKQPTAWYRSDPAVRAYLNDGGHVKLARALALFSAADRLRHCFEVIEPALDRGAFVLCDRYVFSSLVYFAVRGVPVSFVSAINAGIPKPDLALFLHVPSDRLLCRLMTRDGQLRKREEQSTGIIDLIQGRFLDLSTHLDFIDGDRSKDDVEEEVWRTIVVGIPEMLGNAQERN